MHLDLTDEETRALSNLSVETIEAAHRPARDVIVARANSIVTQRWAMITRNAQTLVDAPRGRLSFDELVRVNAESESVWKSWRFD